MKVSRLEWIVLVLTLLILALMGGYFWGSGQGAQPVTITTAVPEATIQLPAAVSPSAAPEGSFPLDLNTATEEELQTLPSIGETRARDIVVYREANGPFTYVEDLRGVKGIGEGILSEIMDYVTVGGTTDGKNSGGR